MSKVRIIDRPDTEMPGRTLEEIFIARLGGKRNYGAFLEQLKKQTRKSRRSES